MSDVDGDGVWTVTIDVPYGLTGYYIFLNGNCGNWSCKENLAGLPCAHPENYNDRILENITGPYTVSTCFNQCTTDGTCAAVPGCGPSRKRWSPVAQEAPAFQSTCRGAGRPRSANGATDFVMCA